MKRMHRYTSYLIVPLLATPALAQAQVDLFDVLLLIANFINLVAPVVFGAAILFFLWGLTKYILQTDTVEGRQAARQIMFWGVVVIFVMASLWGLVNLLGDTFGLNNARPLMPQL